MLLIILFLCVCVQIESCGDVNLLLKLCMDNIDLLVDRGFNKPVLNVD